MKIYTRKRVLNGINIVPMLDILTILLLFFIVHTEFKRQVNVLPLTLPQTHTLAGETGRTDELLLELGADGSMALAGRHIEPTQLAAELRELQRTQPEMQVQVSAAEGASMGLFIEVMDRLTEAGFSVEQVPVRIDYHP